MDTAGARLLAGGSEDSGTLPGLFGAARTPVRASALLAGESREAPEFFLRNADNPDEVYAIGGFQKYAYLTGSPLRWSTLVTWRYNPAGQESLFAQADVLAALQRSTARWEAVCNVRFAYAGTTASAASMGSCDGQNIVGWTALGGNTVGQTQACYSGSGLTEFDMVLDNEQPYQLSSLGLLEAVATHEFGHALGLGHTSVSPAVMTSSVSTGSLVQDDIDGCVSLYGAPSTTTAPVSSLSRTSISFSAQTVGSSSPVQAVRITNAGGSTLTLSSLSIGGSHPSDFGRAGTCATGTSLGAGQYCDVSITFTPLADGTRTAALVVASNAAGSPQTVALSGSGVAPVTLAPAPVLTPNSLAFAPTTLGSTTAAQWVTLANNGTATLTLASVSLQGAHPGDFVLSGTCAASVSLSPGASCSSGVAFRPTAAGSRAATIAYATNAGTLAVSLSGSGVSPVVQPPVAGVPKYSAMSITFRDQSLGTTSKQRSVSLTNVAVAPLVVQQITLAGTHWADYRLGGSCMPGATLAYRDSCTMTLSFTPLAAGLRSAEVDVLTNASQAFDRIVVNGNGVVGPSNGRTKAAVTDVVEYYHAGLDHYFLTSLDAEMTALDSGMVSGWKRTGEIFPAGASVDGSVPTALAINSAIQTASVQEPAPSPVCRFYGNPAWGLESHFYSAFPAECAQVQARFGDAWLLESSTLMYVYVPDMASGACPTASIALYRLYNQRRDVNHRYTVDPAIRGEMIRRGWMPEGYGPDGVAMCLPSG